MSSRFQPVKEQTQSAKGPNLEQDPFLSTESAAKYLNLKPQTLCNWRHLRKGPVYHILGGRRIVYRKSNLDKFSEAGRIDPEALR